jgi:hypothetical protein
MILLGDAAKKVTKKALKKYFSTMLWRLDVNHGIRPVTTTPDEFDLDQFRAYSRNKLTFKPTIFGADEKALHWLIQQHPEYEEKRGCGITGFTVVSTLYGARGFAIVRADGSATDFSFHECLSPKSVRTTVQGTFRYEVADNIHSATLQRFDKYGDELGRVPCALTKKLIDISQSHADHAPPYTFQVLVQTFLTARDIVISEDLLEPRADNQHIRRLADRELAAAWRSYHHELAHIRIVDRDTHKARIEDQPREDDRQLDLRQYLNDRP